MESEEDNEKTRKKNDECDRRHCSCLCDDRWDRVSGDSIRSTDEQYGAE